jgi:hypothetical protein
MQAARPTREGQGIVVVLHVMLRSGAVELSFTMLRILDWSQRVTVN